MNERRKEENGNESWWACPFPDVPSIIVAVAVVMAMAVAVQMDLRLLQEAAVHRVRDRALLGKNPNESAHEVMREGSEKSKGKRRGSRKSTSGRFDAASSRPDPVPPLPPTVPALIPPPVGPPALARGKARGPPSDSRDSPPVPASKSPKADVRGVSSSLLSKSKSHKSRSTMR